MRNKQSSLFFLVVFAPILQACGPWLPEAYVLRNDDVFYTPPKVGFAAELRHLLPNSVPHEAKLNADKPGGQSSVAELCAALGRDDFSTGETEEIVAAYQEFRGRLNSIKPFIEVNRFAYRAANFDPGERASKIRVLSTLRVPASLPDQFRYYLEGALAYYRKDFTSARAAWEALLSLPEAARRERSVMATYMIAKADPRSASKYYPRVRALVAEGYPDPQGLAAASYGKEARAYLDRGQHQRAIDLYLQQWASGYGNAALSLSLVARDIWDNNYSNCLIHLIENKNARAVLTAYLLTQSDSNKAAELRARFLEALPDPKLMSVAESGRFALMEYQRNNLTSARLWVSYAAADDALALWVKSKLLLRAGKIEAGRVLMLALTEEMSAKGENWGRLDTKRAWGELGLLMLREGRYVEAADSFWNARSWQDCAYLLERLLTTEELIAWCAAHPVAVDDELGFYEGEPQALLARRLMRETRFNQAMEYFDTETRIEAENYVEAMKLAGEPSTAPTIRARNYWTAARIMRHSGMALVGSELSPDFAWVGGNYEWGDFLRLRRAYRYVADYQLNQPSGEELKLAGQTRVIPDKRFHYRYRAVQLAELAAGLLPNNDEQASRIYCVAGSWIKTRDPEAADSLFKQLVVRCPQTELGQAALKNKWFPQVDPDLIEPFSDTL